MDTMNALVWKGDGALSLERRPIPALQGPRDASVRVTRSTICTRFLHISSGAVFTSVLPRYRSRAAALG